jgi:hypothetical protein
MSVAADVPLSFLTIVALDGHLGLLVVAKGVIHHLMVTRHQFRDPAIMFRLLDHVVGVNLLDGLPLHAQVAAHNQWATIAEVQLEFVDRRN